MSSGPTSSGTPSEVANVCDAGATDLLADVRALRDEFARFMLSYKFGMEEIATKVRILQEEFSTVHSYNPIEHVSERLKSPESLLAKVQRLGISPAFDSIRSTVVDIAGIRITCSFVSDVYRVFDLLTGQDDITVRTVKDYIARPKDNGYRSLHAIVEVPVFLTDGPVQVPVEVQFRTVAMDFWASLEHKIYYKYQRQVPSHLTESLHQAAQTAAKLDQDMELLHTEMHGHQARVPSTQHAAIELSENALTELIQQRAAAQRHNDGG